MMNSLRVLHGCVALLMATAAFAADPPASSEPSGAPQTVKVASVESASTGAADRKIVFVLIKSESGKCYAVAPPGGEGMVAGDAYAVVAATDMPDEVRAEMTKSHPDCGIVNVVARVAK